MVKILMLLIIILGVGVGLYLVNNRTGFFSRADSSLIPQDVRVTNLADNSFSISWTTSKSTTGYVLAGIEPTKLSATVPDDRDSGGQIDRQTHYVTLKNLDPEKNYYFKVVSGGKSFDAKDKKPYVQKTAPVSPSAPSLPDTITGQIEGGVDTLVYLSVGNNTQLSTYTRGGNWLISLGNSRTADLKEYAKFQPSDLATLFVTSGSGSVEKTFRLSEKSVVSKLALSGGNTAKADSGRICAQVITNACENSNPKNCREFPTPCDVPEGWSAGGGGRNVSSSSQPSKGVLDSVDCNTISGWTCDGDNYNTSLDVHIYDGVAGVGKVVASGKADRERPDLKTANNTCNGTTKHGFSIAFPDSLKDGKEHTIYAYGIGTPASSEGNSQLWSNEPKKVTCSASQSINADITGPKTGKVGQTISAGSYSSRITATQGISAVGMVLYKDASDNWSCPYVAPVIDGIKYCFIQATDNPTGNSTTVFSKDWTPDKPGTYKLIIDVIDTAGKKCSGSHNRAVSDFDCGSNDSLELVIN